MAGCGSTALIGPLGPNSKIQRHNARKASESAGKSVPTPCSTSAASIAVAGGAGDQLSFAVFLYHSLQFIRLSALNIQVTVHADSAATLWLLDVLEESWRKTLVAAASCWQVQRRLPQWPARSSGSASHLGLIWDPEDSSLHSKRLGTHFHNWTLFSIIQNSLKILFILNQRRDHNTP